MDISNDRQQTFLEHLEELRRVIIRMLIAVAALFPVACYFVNDAINLLVKYSCPAGFKLHYFTPLEPLFVQLKVAFCLALFGAAPYIAYSGWRFLVPALYPHERMHIKRLAAVSLSLFLAGLAFCLFFIVPAMMKFSFHMQNESLQQTIGLSQYLGLVAMLMLGFGFVFQLPIVIFFLVIAGIVSLQTLKKQRAVVLVIILTISAVLTPPDVFSQFMMAIPTYALFELSLLAAAATLKRRRPVTNSEMNDTLDAAETEGEPETASVSPVTTTSERSLLHYPSSSGRPRRRLKARPRRHLSRRKR